MSGESILSSGTLPISIPGSALHSSGRVTENVMGGDSIPRTVPGPTTSSSGRVTKNEAHGKPANFYFALSINSCVKEWITCADKEEIKLTRYLGLAHVVELQSLAASWPVLDIIPIFQPFESDILKSRPFEILHSPTTREIIKDIIDPERQWPVGEVWDESNEMIRSKRKAWCLLHLPMLFDVYRAQTSDEREAKNIESRAKFEARFGRVCAKQDIQYEPPFPVFGPSGIDGRLEHLNRSWELLKYVSSLMNPDWYDRKVFPVDKSLWTYPKDILNWMEDMTHTSPGSRSRILSAYFCSRPPFLSTIEESATSEER
ncbi:Helicase C-terminal [Penicillium nucicola]|uniref:Helicase C-terminal n=1 Tax=Penicillium nucicola TaxID=1850975 RepID=UPI0025456C96|nr:Helicase C-terminal [Penicillium nucicola]KAJ5762397.1 Helicase C-terminal [Penicillium nucicola]